MINYKIATQDLRSAFGLFNTNYSYNNFTIIRSEMDNKLGHEIRIHRNLNINSSIITSFTFISLTHYIGFRIKKRYK